MGGLQPLTVLRGVFGSGALVAAIGVLIWLVVRSRAPPFHPDRPLVLEAELFVPLFYAVVVVFGLLPPLAINLWTGEWCAPPFNYPPQKASVVYLHVVPSVLWLAGSTLQVYLTTLEAQDPFRAHRAFGLAGMTSIFVAFELTAMFSLVSELSPLGKHVQFMEWVLAIGTWVIFVVGLCLAPLGPDYHDGHKVCMIVAMLFASGPGCFRVLRHIREAASCRLWKAKRFTNYADVDQDPAHWKNFKDVESTYFCMAFLVTDAYALLALWSMKVLARSGRWWLTLLCWLLVVLPVFGVVLGACLRFWPGIHDDFKFKFALNYNFEVLKGARAAPTRVGGGEELLG